MLGRSPIIYGKDDTGFARVDDVVKDLGGRGIVSLMVEGGPTVARSFIDANAVDRYVWYIAARLAAGSGIPAIGGAFATIRDSHVVEIVDVTMVGDDIRVDARPTDGS